MRAFRTLPSLALGLTTLALAAAPAPKGKAAAPATPAPLLDRDIFFGNPELSGAQLSPDGAFIAFMKPHKGVVNVWVKKTGEPYAAARLVTADPRRPIAGFFWSRDGKYLLFVQDRDGDENYNVYAVDPRAEVEAGKEVPPARNLTAAKNVRAMISSLPKGDPDTMYVGLNDRDAAWHDLYRVKISTGERTLLRKNTERIAGWVFDNRGQLRLAMRTNDKGETELLKPDGDGFKTIYTVGVFEEAAPIHFHKDGRHIYLQTNKGNRNLTELVLFDPETGKETKVESDPLKRVDFGGAMFSELTEELISTSYEDERARIYFKDKAWKADYELLKQKLPGREINLGSMTQDEQLVMVSASSDVDPGTRYLFNRKTKELKLEYVSRERVPREHMAPMQAIRYRSSDGLEIPAYLTLPKGVPARKLPMVVVPHGGPWARDSWGYNSFAQFLANRGYAVLQPNFRGSTGYGKAFLNAGNKQWGDRMQDDLTWGVKTLSRKGTIDGNRVAIMGGSYGGYATLAGVTFTPNLYKAGISIVGPSNLLTLLDTIPSYWEAIRIVFHERMGNPNTPDGKAQLERQSPLTHAAKITTPLMVVQGANDPRVKKSESDQIVVALRDRGFPVEYLCAPDEGHGFHRPVNNMAMFAASEKFLAKYLGGRFQEGGTDDVMARLKEITVDPRTVVLARKVDASKLDIPTPAADLGTFTCAYAGSLSVQGQNMPVTVQRVVKEAEGRWSVTDTVKLPMGEMSDATELEKGTLLLRRRGMKQGPVVLDASFQGGKVSGSMGMGGQNKPIQGEVGSELYADHDEAYARLPLADGFSATLKAFDLQKQKVQLRAVKVVGSEEVKGRKTWKVEVTSAEGDPGSSILWVAQDDRRILKTEVTVPEMGNALIKLELQ